METTIRIKKNSAHERAELPPTDLFGHFEVCRKVPLEMGAGSIRGFGFTSGIQVYINDFLPTDTYIHRSGSSDGPAFGFRFCISGNTRLDLDCLDHPLTLKSGRCGFFYYPSLEGVHEDMAGTHIHRILILIRPGFFLSLVGEDLYRLPRQIRAPLKQAPGSGDPFNITDIITPAMSMALDQILHCPYGGATRRIFIEAKAMELMACMLDRLKPAEKKVAPGFRLKAVDMDRIHSAGQMLAENLQTPPNIDELARSLGVSRTKLYQDFNQFYGRSPIEYLRFKRIEKARAMVRDKDLNLTQIAYTLGYSSSSHFAKAFKAEFGMPPSRYRRNPPC